MVTGIGTVVMQQQMMNGGSPVSEPAKRASDNRRSNKPIMEKRRRARINNCLNELKTLILDATKKDPARHSKLEKADILEKTVKYLQDLQRQQSAMTQAADPSIVNKFKAGFTECAKEVDRFQGIEPVVKRRLLQHLSNYLNGVKSDHQQQLAQQLHTQQQIATQLQQPQLQQVQIHMLPSSPPGSPEQSQQSSHIIGAHPEHQQQQQILKLTPTNGYYFTLPNGIITYVAPAQMPQPQQQQLAALPQLVPIPSRTSSTASAASSAASTAYERLSTRDTSSSPISYAPLSPANSYEAMEYQESTPASQLPAIDQCRQSSPPPLQLRPSSQSCNTVADDDVDDDDVDEDEDESSFDLDVQRSDSPVPLSLVMKKSLPENMMDDEDRPWRPW